METMNELEEMRTALNKLNAKLEKETLVNDRMLRRSMKREVNSISRNYTVVVVIAALAIPYNIWCFRDLIGVSWLFTLFTSFFLLLAIGYTLWCGYYLRGNMMSGELLEVSRKVAKAKKLEHEWLKIGIPFILLWTPWFFYEIYKVSPDAKFICIGGAVGCIVGLIAGLIIRRRTMISYNEVLTQIDEVVNN